MVGQCCICPEPPPQWLDSRVKSDECCILSKGEHFQLSMTRNKTQSAQCEIEHPHWIKLEKYASFWKNRFDGHTALWCFQAGFWSILALDICCYMEKKNPLKKMTLVVCNDCLWTIHNHYRTIWTLSRIEIWCAHPLACLKRTSVCVLM